MIQRFSSLSVHEKQACFPGCPFFVPETPPDRELHSSAPRPTGAFRRIIRLSGPGPPDQPAFSKTAFSSGKVGVFPEDTGAASLPKGFIRHIGVAVRFGYSGPAACRHSSRPHHSPSVCVAWVSPPFRFGPAWPEVNAPRHGWAFPSGAVPPLPVRQPLFRL